MNNALPIIVCSTFIVLALWHFYMAVRSHPGFAAAVPGVDGKPLFMPTKKMTIAVGVALLLFTLLVAATAGLLLPGVPEMLLTWLCYALALALFARAIGDFKYVGFFKRVRDSRFAGLDTLLCLPLCLLLAVDVVAIALQRSA